MWLDDRGTGQWKWLEEVPRRTLYGGTFARSYSVSKLSNRLGDLTLPSGQPCGLPMDQTGRHACICCRHLMRRQWETILHTHTTYSQCRPLLRDWAARDPGDQGCRSSWHQPGLLKTSENDDRLICGRQSRCWHVCRRTSLCNMTWWDHGSYAQAARGEVCWIWHRTTPTPEPVWRLSPLVFEVAGAMSQSCIGFCRFMICHNGTKIQNQNCSTVLIVALLGDVLRWLCSTTCCAHAIGTSGIDPSED